MINLREALRNIKSIRGGMLRLVLIAGAAALFLITRMGILDPRPAPREALSDKELRVTLGAMALADISSPPANSRDQRLAAFGKKLFFDTRLSSNGQVACATCHIPDKSFTDGLPTGRGVGITNRNTPTIINSGLGHWFFWDGRADSLAAQALGPLENPNEHGLTRSSLAVAIEKFHGASYGALFGEAAVGQPNIAGFTPQKPNANTNVIGIAGYTLASIGPYKRLTSLLKLASNQSIQPSALVAQALQPEQPGQRILRPESAAIVVANAALAIAAWEKLQIANQSPFDGFMKKVRANPDRPLAELADGTALAGLRIFTGKGNCILCHRGASLSDQQFHNIGLGDTARLEELPVKAWLADVVGRAKGQIEVLASEFNCRAGIFEKASAGPDAAAAAASRIHSESCREQEFADPDNLETVGAFKTPTLRNVAVTGPYFHDGRAASLDDVLDHYDHLKTKPAIGHREESLRPLNLSAQEKSDLKAFLESLTSPVRDLSEN